MIRSLDNNFNHSKSAKDENSQAYCLMLKGEVPQTSQNTQSHIASRLLTLRFLDIIQSLEKGNDLDGEDMVRKNIVILNKKVCFNV